MKIADFFKMTNWKIGKFLAVIFTVQILLLVVIGLEQVGIKIPLLRQIIAFFYLTFIPGILIIRTLKMHELTGVYVVLYSVGLSIASIMLVGFLMNVIYPIFGIHKPLSFDYLIFTFFALVLVLSILSYIRDREFYREEFVDLSDIFSNYSLFLYLLPFLAIIGTYMVNFYTNNILLMVLMVLICIMPVLVAYNKIPEKYYPLAIFSISISLLFHTSLITNYIWGWDIYAEYHYADLVLNNAFWNPLYDNSVNSTLSIVMLGSIFSMISNINLNFIFKIVYPVLFSFLPIGLYVLFNKYTNDQIAFFSCFFFMAIFTFFGEMLSLARQEIAELFLVLLILAVFSKNIKPILFVIFGMALIASHYGLAYIYMFILSGVWIVSMIITNTRIRCFIGKFYLIKTKLSNNISYDLNGKLTLNFVFLFIVFSIFWYAFVSGHSTFEILIHTINNVIANINVDFLNPDTSQGLNILTAALNSPMRQIAKYLHMITQLFIIIGFLGLIFSKYENKFNINYIIFSFFSILICLSAVLLPYFSGSFNTSRLYGISLIFIAPFAILGSRIIFSYFNMLILEKNKAYKNSLQMVSIFLVVFFLFNSGFAIEFSADYPSSLALSKNSYVHFFEHDSDVASAQWLMNFNTSEQIYADYFSKYSLMSYGNLNNIHQIYNWTDFAMLKTNSYLYIRSGDINAQITKPPDYNAYSLKFTQDMNRIYDSNSEIYIK